MANSSTVSRMSLLPQQVQPLRSVKAGPVVDESPSLEIANDLSVGDEVKEPEVEAPENFLGRYFKEMAVLSVLKPEEEFESAKNIEALERDLWAHILGYPALLEAVGAVVDMEMERVPRSLQPLRRAARAIKARSAAAQRRRYCAQAAQVGKSIYDLDVDRRALLAVIRELSRIAQHDVDRVSGAEIPVKVDGRAFQEYLAEVRLRLARAQRARNEFVKANLRLVVSIARRFNHGRMPLGDLIQEGNVGLIKAVERYDYRRGYRFSTYASWWIRHAISRALADKGRAVRLPVHMIDAYHKVSKTRRELSSRFGRSPTSEEISDECGISYEKVQKIEGCLMEQAVSLDREVGSDDGRRFVDFLQDEEAALPSDGVMYRSSSRQVMDIMGELKPIEAEVLRKRFGLEGQTERTLKEIGQDYDLSRERIRQIQEQAIDKIRTVLEQHDAL